MKDKETSHTKHNVIQFKC